MLGVNDGAGSAVTPKVSDLRASYLSDTTCVAIHVPLNVYDLEGDALMRDDGENTAGHIYGGNDLTRA
ncbi:hypothetical protein TPAR_06836 [Tolypocladium paradoxum]|uniref:Uncharacterized protein n=1 Tax=Tolypocladium paradoxum TaxID=94208 RepID=A0A2S4KRZ4_9HYPO|nr:hypothetical protein TPAR_06836 [Tolypocladium paradoxum]